MIWIATLETHRHSFVAVGSTRYSAMRAMKQTMIQHARRYDVPHMSFLKKWEDAINVDSIVLDAEGIVR